MTADDHSFDRLAFIQALPSYEALPKLEIGSLLIAKKDSHVCQTGEIGICYDAYMVNDQPVWSVLFEAGHDDCFSAYDVSDLLHLTGQHAPELNHYAFRSTVQLAADYRRGRFAKAFAQCRAIADDPVTGISAAS